MFCSSCGAPAEISFAFCPRCGWNIRNISGKDMEESLRYYFQKGFSYKKILLFLSKYHNTELSMRTLQQRLHDMGLKRRNVSYDVQEVRREIMKNLNGPRCSGGYRSHRHTLRLKGIQVPQRVVEELCQLSQSALPIYRTQFRATASRKCSVCKLKMNYPPAICYLVWVFVTNHCHHVSSLTEVIKIRQRREESKRPTQPYARSKIPSFILISMT